MSDINELSLERQFSTVATGNDLMAQLAPLLERRSIRQFVAWAERTLDLMDDSEGGPNAVFYGILSELRDYDRPSFDWIMYCLSLSRNDNLVGGYWVMAYEANDQAETE